jgi:hypothetical protein
MKGSFHIELDFVFDKFIKYHTKMLLGDFNDRVGKEEIFKPNLGTRVHTTLVIMQLEQYNSPNPKIPL